MSTLNFTQIKCMVATPYAPYQEGNSVSFSWPDIERVEQNNYISYSLENYYGDQNHEIQ